MPTGRYMTRYERASLVTVSWVVSLPSNDLHVHNQARVVSSEYISGMVCSAVAGMVSSVCVVCRRRRRLI